MRQLIFAIALCVTALTSNALFGQFADSRWGTTATNGGGLQRGDATTLTWGFVADGTTISGSEGTSGSDLVSFLDTNIGAGGGGADLTNRPWFTLFQDAYDRWGEVSGLSFVYEANDGGARIDGFEPPLGQLGVYADMRIGGHSIDGQVGSNTLAYNYFPEHGDMVIDTDNSNFYGNNNNNYVGLRNVVAHEVGHGLGMPHFESSNFNGLMEPSINTSFDGPQIDDIYQAHRRYGDALEKNGGNDNFADATNLGQLIADAQALAVGADANTGSTAALVTPDQTDFASIDGTSDDDWFTFNLTEAQTVTMLLEMVGPTYQRGPQNGSQSAFNLAEQNNLDLALFDVNGNLIEDSLTGGFDDENIEVQLAAGSYFAVVTGNTDAAQFYQLSVSGVSAIPEPTSFALLGVALFGFCAARRRRQA